MPKVLIITSAAYPEPELEAEMGRIPPAFLPLGNRRLFTHQLAELDADRIILSLPEDFEPDAADLQLLNGVEIVKVSAGLSLGQSLVYVINASASVGAALAVLHGDTLLRGLPQDQSDVVSIAAAPAEYRWGRVPPHVVSGPSAVVSDTDVLSGYFAFANAALLVQSVTRAGGDFVAALEIYAAAQPLRAIRGSEWLDFGHASTFHRSRQRVTTERKLNHLEISRRAVVKTGIDAKIRAEARWYEELPPPLRVYAPAYLGSSDQDGRFSYAVEYLRIPTLTDLYVFGRLPRPSWHQIFQACDEFLSACNADPAPAGVQPDNGLYLEKTLLRLESYARSANLDLSAPCRFDGRALPSLERIARLAAEAIAPIGADRLGRIHGDFCFSNIFYDSRGQLVRAIDPRGLASDGSASCYGDVRYDIAKLFHSAEGGYDHIIAGYYDLERPASLEFSLRLPNGPLLESVRQEFRDSRFAGLTPTQADARAIAVLLFLAMPPLHQDAPDRQLAFLANAMRLFLELDR